MDIDKPATTQAPLTVDSASASTRVCSEIIRSEKFWLKDGSLVLQAENIQFCIHGGLLSMKSVVFKDMLDVPQGGADSQARVQCVDGRPLVHVSDTAEEMEYFLDALYNPLELGEVELDSATVPQLCAILQLSTKYMISSFRKIVSAAFETTYPSDLALAKDLIEFDFMGSWEADVANTLTETCLLTPQVFLFYQYCCAGSGFGKGGIITSTVLGSGLSVGNQKKILETQRVVRAAVRNYALKALDYPQFAALEASHADCVLAATALLQELAATEWVNLTHRLQPFYLHAYNPSEDFCHKCRDAFRIRIWKEREALWDALPELLGFGTWQEVLSADEAYLANMARDKE